MLANTDTNFTNKAEEKSGGRQIPIVNDWGLVVDNLHQQFDRLYGQIFRAHQMFGTPLTEWRDVDPLKQAEKPFRGFSNLPQTDVAEDDDGFTISVELPGLDENDIDLSTKNGRLTISGEKTTERDDVEKNYHIKERRYGSFRRSFNIPEYVNDNNIKADFSRGVLTITLPKKPSAASTARKIKITAVKGSDG